MNHAITVALKSRTVRMLRFRVATPAGSLYGKPQACQHYLLPRRYFCGKLSKAALAMGLISLGGVIRPVSNLRASSGRLLPIAFA